MGMRLRRGYAPPGANASEGGPAERGGRRLCCAGPRGQAGLCGAWHWPGERARQNDLTNYNFELSLVACIPVAKPSMQGMAFDLMPTSSSDCHEQHTSAEYDTGQADCHSSRDLERFRCCISLPAPLGSPRQPDVSCAWCAHRVMVLAAEPERQQHWRGCQQCAQQPAAAGGHRTARGGPGGWQDGSACLCSGASTSGSMQVPLPAICAMTPSLDPNSRSREPACSELHRYFPSAVRTCVKCWKFCALCVGSPQNSL